MSPVSENRKRSFKNNKGGESKIDPIQGLSASSNLSQETGHPGNDIRPCIATLIETPLQKGGFPNRNEAALIIATELCRIGVDFDSATKRIENWNRQNDPPLKPGELRNALNNGYKGKYNYGCRNPILESFCIGEDICPFITKVKSQRKWYNDLCFLDYGWQKYLTNCQVLIYYVALTYLEKSRKIGPGGLICANHNQIASSCGISQRHVGKNLIALQVAGLIEYKRGKPLKWEGIASEVRRILPIPRPSHTSIDNIKNLNKQNTNMVLDTVLM